MLVVRELGPGDGPDRFLHQMQRCVTVLQVPRLSVCRNLSRVQLGQKSAARNRTAAFVNAKARYIRIH